VTGQRSNVTDRPRERRDERDSHEQARRRMRWMEQVQRGDDDAYRTLLDDIAPSLAAFLRSRAPTADLEDVYQEVLLAVHRVRHTYDPRRPFEPWLFAIARFVAVSYFRRQVRVRREVIVEITPDVAVGDEGPGTHQIAEALRGLSPTEREAIRLLQVEGLSFEQAAARMGTTPGAAKVRGHRAYKALRRLLGA
jgi:RNA polymerase sigma-70 factor, ECF subfamily